MHTLRTSLAAYNKAAEDPQVLPGFRYLARLWAEDTQKEIDVQTQRNWDAYAERKQQERNQQL